MHCSACGHENRTGRKFCVECGAALALACAACGAPYDAGEKFCGECGAAVGPAAPRPPVGPAAPVPRPPADAGARKVLTHEVVATRIALRQRREPQLRSYTQPLARMYSR
jgi:hypothetical protein